MKTRPVELQRVDSIERALWQ